MTPDGILRGYHLADQFMSDQNATKPMRNLSSVERDEFFLEYERRVISGSGVDVSPETALKIWRRIREMPYSMTLFDDVIPSLETLRSSGFTIGLISNMNQSGDDLAESMGLAPWLDFTVTSLEVGAEKPHPPIFLAALEKAGAQPEESVHVGDQLSSDIEGARGVGIAPVLLDRDGNHVGIAATPRIQSLSELPGIIGQL